MLDGTFIALLKYHEAMTTDELLRAVERIRRPLEFKQKILDEDVIARGRAFRHGDRLHYAYAFGTAQEQQALLDGKDVARPVKAAYDSLCRYREIVHPLRYGRSIFSGADPWGRLRGFAASAARHPLFMVGDDVTALVDRAFVAIEDWGLVVLSAHPWKRRTATRVVAELKKRFGRYGLQVEREDVAATWNGQPVEETHYRLMSETHLYLRALRSNPAFNVGR
jgi:hypothetical protein